MKIWDADTSWIIWDTGTRLCPSNLCDKKNLQIFTQSYKRERERGSHKEWSVEPKEATQYYANLLDLQRSTNDLLVCGIRRKVQLERNALIGFTHTQRWYEPLKRRHKPDAKSDGKLIWPYQLEREGEEWGRETSLNGNTQCHNPLGSCGSKANHIPRGNATKKVTDERPTKSL